MTKDEALKLALEALEEPKEHFAKHRRLDAITAIKDALAQPEQEPVAWVSSEELLVMRGNALGGAKDWRINVGLVKQNGDVGLYTIPPQRTWVGLTDEEVDQFETWYDEEEERKGWVEPRLVAQYFEAKLKEKNNG